MRKKENFTAEAQRTAEGRRERQNPKTHKLMEISCLFGEQAHCCDSRFNIIQERKRTLTIFSHDRRDHRGIKVYFSASSASLR